MRLALRLSLCLLAFGLGASMTMDLLTARPHKSAPVVQAVAAPTSIEQCLKVSEVFGEDPEDGIGSCWPCAVKDGCVAFISCQHVAACGVTAVRMPNGDRAPVMCSIMNEDLDVAVIWVRANPHLPVVPMPLAPKNPDRGAHAMLAGYPLDCGLWMSEGYVGTADPRYDITWTSVPVYYGCSGGPVLVDGRVVGVVQGIRGDEWRHQKISTISAIKMVDAWRGWVQEVVALGPK